MQTRGDRVFFLLLLFALVFRAGTAVAQSNLQTSRDVNLKLLQLAQAQPAAAGDYRIGSGDLLSISVFDVPDLTRDVRVSASGHISLPLIPIKIGAGGLTSYQLEEKIAELLQVNGLVEHPQVTVFVKEYHSQPITVIGAVRNTTVYQAIRPTTLLEVLSYAGGLADDAGSVVIVTRPKPLAVPEVPTSEDNPVAPQLQTIVINLKDLLESGDPQFNIPVFGGDIVSVPRAGILYVVGAVNRSGGFALKSDSEEMTALKAVALAEGLTGTARADDAVIIRKHRETGKEEEIEVDLGKIMARKSPDVGLYANDILFIPDSIAKKGLRRAAEAAIGITAGLIVYRRW